MELATLLQEMNEIHGSCDQSLDGEYPATLWGPANIGDLPDKNKHRFRRYFTRRSDQYRPFPETLSSREVVRAGNLEPVPTYRHVSTGR